MPVYWQACHGKSAERAGVLMLSTAVLAPMSMVAGAAVKITGRYRPQMWLGWIFCLVALGLLSTLKANTSIAHGIGYSLLIGAGIG